MNFVAVFMLFFAVLGAIDLIIGNKFGLGAEFEKGYKLLGTIVLTIVGMIVIAPVVGEWLRPALDVLYNSFGIEPSLLPTMIFANDMGGAPLAEVVTKDMELGLFNGLVVSSMMGCTISFTIPFALGAVNPEKHQYVLLGLLCGIVTIPIGCFVAGLVKGIAMSKLLFNILPMVVFSLIIALGLKFIPGICVKVFGIFGRIIQVIIIIGLVLGMITYLTGFEIIKGFTPIEEGALICFNAAVVMSGAFPFLYIVSRLTERPMERLGKKMGINKNSALGFISSLATSYITFPAMNNMDKKGIVLNSAFAVSAAFTFAEHLAFTMAYNADYILCVTVGKLMAGVTSVILALVVCKKTV